MGRKLKPQLRGGSWEGNPEGSGVGMWVGTSGGTAGQAWEVAGGRAAGQSGGADLRVDAGAARSRGQRSQSSVGKWHWAEGCVEL